MATLKLTAPLRNDSGSFGAKHIGGFATKSAITYSADICIVGTGAAGITPGSRFVYDRRGGKLCRRSGAKFMPDRQWFVASGGKQYGPFSEERFRQLISGGKITADTLVWCEGMTDWAPAGDIPGLMPATRPPPVPVRAAAPTDGTAQALSTTVSVWPLFGRLLLLWLSLAILIPFPWVAVNFLRWFVDHIELPEQQRVSFVGKVGDIWYIFVLYVLCGLVALAVSLLVRGSAPSHFSIILVQLLFAPLPAFFALIITRWFYANLVWRGQSGPLRFTGGYWALLGWMLLATVSFISIIGWAWVYTAWARWMCRNVTGINRKFVFTASGLSLLGRSLLLYLSCLVIVPIPWTLRWYIRWLISQFALTI